MKSPEELKAEFDALSPERRDEIIREGNARVQAGKRCTFRWWSAAIAGRQLVEKAKVEPSASPKPEAVVTRMSDVVAMPIRWLWPSWIPLGMVTVLDGDPGLGKSTFTIDIMARLSRGEVMPDGSPGPDAAGAVILTAEDDLARVIRPRLDAACADVDRVATVHVKTENGEKREITLTPEDLMHLDKAVLEVRAVAVVVDPLMAYLPADVNSHRDQDVRRTMGLLRDFAERTGVAVVVVRHLNKSESVNVLYRGGGSIGIVGAARAGLLLASDPDDPTGGTRVLAVTKANLALRPPSLELRIVADPGQAQPRVEWGGESRHTCSTLLAVPEGPEAGAELEYRRGRLQEAEDFLREALAGGPVPARDVKRDARDAGISDASLKRAKLSLAVRARKVGAPGGDQRWEWSLSSENLEPLEPLRVERGGKSLQGAGVREGDQDAQSNPLIAKDEPLRSSGDSATVSEVVSAEGDQGDHRIGDKGDAGEGDDPELTPVCPRCGGRLLRWASGEICTKCHRPLHERVHDDDAETVAMPVGALREGGAA